MINYDKPKALKTANVAAQAAEPAGKASLLAHADTSEYIKLHPDHVARALNIGRIVDAGELLALLQQLRKGAVSDSNRIGELSTALSQMTEKRDALNNENNGLREENKTQGREAQRERNELNARIERAQAKLNDVQWKNDRQAEQIAEQKETMQAMSDQCEKLQATVQILQRERDQARAAFRAVAQRMTFEDLCDLLLNWGTDK